jgi:SM-20-related protein
MNIELNPNLDIAALTKAFSAARKLRINDILTAASAEYIHHNLVNSTAWHLVHSDSDGKPTDYPPETLDELSDQQHQRLMSDLYERASNSYQYMYKYFPIINAIQGGSLPSSSMLFEAANFLNSTEFIAFSRELTSTNSLVKVDPQATLYEPGHFLSTHDDSNYHRSAADQSSRRFAIVLGFTKDWSENWGGQTSFFEDTMARSSQSWYPGFNTLAIFEVPILHCVNYVTPFAAHGRYSLTGWLRDDPSIKRPDLGDR